MGFHFQDSMIKYIMNLEKLHNIYKVRDLIFDLDNTILDENEYLLSAYSEISKKISKHNNHEIFNFLKKEFIENGRKNIYQKMIKNFNIKEFEIIDFLNILRNHKPDKELKTLIWFQEFMKLISVEFPIYLITNGNIAQQKNKLNNLIIPENSYFAKIIFASQYKPKPFPDSYLILKKYLTLKKPLYIGDSEIDKIFANNAGIDFINVKYLKS